MKIVTSSGRGREKIANSLARLTRASLSSVTWSIGIRPRYSIRRPTSAARRRRDRSADDLADLAQGSVAERRHGLTGWS